MYNNSALPEARYRVESKDTRSDHTTVTPVGQSGQRTIEGAVMMAVALFAVVMAASYPVPVAVLIAAVIGISVVIRYVKGDVPLPDDSTQRSGYQKGDQNRSVSSS